MEQIQDEMRMNQGKKNALASMRAVERQSKMPQNLMNNELEHSHDVRGGGAAGLARVIGSGRKGRGSKASVQAVSRGAGRDGAVSGDTEVRSPTSTSTSTKANTRGNRTSTQTDSGNTTFNVYGKMSGRGKRGHSSDSSCSSDSEMEGGAKHMGRMMYAHLAKVHGEGYARKFMSGGAAPRNLPPMGVEVEHARMSPAGVGLPGSGLGGQDVPPGGMAPMAYGSAPQAPASFQRNSVSIGSQGLLPNAQVGSGKYKKQHVPGVHHTMNEMEGCGSAGGKAAYNVRGVYDGVSPGPATTVVKGGARAMRGAAISKLMKEKGMSLPEASKYLKEHGTK